MLEAFAPNEEEWKLDPGIREADLVLRSGGVETFESCDGGDVHSFHEPTVRFHGDSWAGYMAFAVAMDHDCRSVSYAACSRRKTLT